MLFRSIPDIFIVAIYCVMKYVIKPIIATNKDIRDIIDGIDNGEGDLTKRVRVISNDEISDLGNGINLFMDKLQEILKLIIENTNYMENVVAEVDGSVVKSNDSASDLSAMTEELSATMQDVGLSVNTINDNADDILKDVEIIATKSDDINQFSKEMKANAEKIESDARYNMVQTGDGIIIFSEPSHCHFHFSDLHFYLFYIIFSLPHLIQLLPAEILKILPELTAVLRHQILLHSEM